MSRRKDRSVNCWPDGHRGNPCQNTVPDTEYETLCRYGWGMSEAVDDGAASGLGFFYMCPIHRMDISEDQRTEAIRLYCEATGKTEDEL